MGQGTHTALHFISNQRLLAVVLALLIAADAAATDGDSANVDGVEHENPALEAVQEPFGPPDEEESADEPGLPGEDGCDRHDEEALQEESQELLRSMSCHTFRWFDGLWGDSEDFDEKAVNGLLTVGAEYTEYDEFDPRFRLRVRAPLPNLSTRWDLILGRVDEEAFVSDTEGQDKDFYNPGVVDRGEDEEWLLGLGHRGRERKSGWDYSAGVRLRLPPRPYVKAQWYYNHDFSDRSDFRFRQTFFWRADQGFGTTSRGDLAYSLNDRDVLRWEGIGTIHEETHGVQWYFGQTWYHIVPNREGQTDWEVPVREYGVQMIWRQPFTRDWLYLSLGPRISWPRDFEEQERDLSLGFGVWLEMEFGRWRW